nr:hypothetical protein [Tanacetum cinerariifolium]
MESSNDSDQEINANMVFMAQIEKILSESEASSSSADEKISKVSYCLSESESEYEYETSEYYDNSTDYGLFVNNDDDQEIFHDAIESASENFIENHIDSQKDYDKSDEKYATLEAERYEYMIRYSAYFDNDKQHRKQIADQQTVHMIMPSKDNLHNGRKGIGFENTRYFEKAKDLRPTLYDEKVIGLGYTSMFLTHSNEALEIEKFKRSRENKIEFAYDYGNLNAIEKEYDKEENPNVIAPGMFKLNVSQSVSPISMTKSSCVSKNVEIKLKRKRRKRKSSK